MIEKDNIQELFSKAFENQTSPVRPELWAGVQAKMAAAGVASTATVVTKGLSVLTKWLIGSAVVGTVGVVATVVMLNSGGKSVSQKEKTPQKEAVRVATVTEETPVKESTLPLNTAENSGDQKVSEKEKSEMEPGSVVSDKGQNNQMANETKLTEETNSISDKKADDKKIVESKQGEEKKSTPVPAGGTSTAGTATTTGGKVSEMPSKKYPENTDKQVFANLETKVTHFPNAFTPNNDGQNDTYFVKVENINDFRLIIFDDHNILVFETNDSEEHWDGRNQAGEEAPEGMYAAVVTGKQQNGKSFRDIQMFQLIRH
ncbi:gliding motility-associated C-terminal domain-containing protein [Fluviicola sp.]|uniref:T9SS type B sorting domain-containing protein n=1 Tax=Fluviicola sp. TaxID=1917219 RepID=UPI00281E1323|nr:gliding motility-associated C-terminal domain-containing protein [Fluviicola sp.]MDR0802237.1 gliding motility-associated C-terminal domain-containing protein [Fluviicola sp.]